MADTYELTFGLPKGRNFPEILSLLTALGYELPAISTKDRQLIQFSKCGRLRLVILRDTDMPAYVEHGAVDLSVVGKDVLLEQEKNLYEPLDLKFGGCRISVAGPAGCEERYKNSSSIRVATKFVNITESFFREKGVNVEVIPLKGGMELAPLVGLSDYIVDLVSTGKTLRENGLVELETIGEISARLVVNRASMKLKRAILLPLIEKAAEMFR